MTPVVLLGGLMSGVYGAALGEFGVAFGAGMMLHGFCRDWFSWLNFSTRGAASFSMQVVYALLRGITIMVLCFAGCAIATQLGNALHAPAAALFAQGIWAGILVDSMLVNDDGGSKRRRKTNVSDRIRDLTASVVRIHGTPVPAGARA